MNKKEVKINQSDKISKAESISELIEVVKAVPKDEHTKETAKLIYAKTEEFMPKRK